MDAVWPQGDDKHDDHNRCPIHNRCTYHHYDGSPDDYDVNYDNDYHNDHNHHNDGCSDNHDLCPW